MKASELIALFERMAAERWSYAWGAAREGCVDCSGAFTYAFREFGQSIDHGANTIARSRIQGGMRKACEARPGWAVFKWREANDGMPEKYRHDGLGDFYHIGLLAADGQSVLNAKGEAYGFCRDPLTGAAKWAYAAPLKGVDYGEEDEPMEALYRARVSTEKDPLRVRDAPGSGRIIGHVPRGRTVEVLADSGDGATGWPYVRYGELVGYASGAYLTRVYDTETNRPATNPPDGGGQGPQPFPNGTEDGEGSAPEVERVCIPLADAQAIYEALGEAYRALSMLLDVD